MAFVLTEEQKLEVAQFLTESDATASFVASNEQLFKDTITTSFLQGQPRAGKGNFPDPTRTLDEQIDDPVSARGEFFGNVKRASTNVQSLSESELFVTAYLASEYYGAGIDFDKLNDPAYSETLQGLFQQTFSNIEAGMSPRASMQEFNIARLDAAERNAVIREAQEPIREVQAMMKSLGIEVSGVNGEMTEADLTNLFQEIGSSDVGLSMTPAGQNFITFLQNQRNEVFGETPADFNPEEAMKYLRHIADGQDFSEIIEKTVALGDEATEEQISMVQAITGSEVTGKWELETIDAAKAYLENPRGDGFPDSFYSAVSQTNPDLPPGMVSVNALRDGFKDGSIPQLTDEQMDSIYNGLSEQPLDVQIDMIATWAASDPSHRTELGSMINANTPAADTATMTALDTTIREAVVTRMEQEEAAKQAIDTGAEVANTVADIPSMAIDTTGVDDALIRAETARINDDPEALSAAMTDVLAEKEAVLIEAEGNFLRHNGANIERVGNYFAEQGYEYAAIFQAKDLNAIDDFFQSLSFEEKYDVTYEISSNVMGAGNIGPILAGTMPSTGWSDIQTARAEVKQLRNDLAPDAPEETAPEEPASPESPTDAPDGTLHLSSLEDTCVLSGPFNCSAANLTTAPKTPAVEGGAPAFDDARRIAAAPQIA